MSNEKRVDETEIEKTNLVLQEILLQQAEANKLNSDTITAINTLTSKITGFEDKLKNLRVTAPATDFGPIRETLKNSIGELKMTVAGQPVNVTKKVQILLFPEQDAKLFYKIVFGRWLIGLLVMLFLFYCYKCAIHKADNDKAVTMEILKNDELKQSWYYLYKKGGKKLRREMDSIVLFVRVNLQKEQQ